MDSPNYAVMWSHLFLYGVFRCGNNPRFYWGKKKERSYNKKAACFMQAAKCRKQFKNLSQIKNRKVLPVYGWQCV